MRLKAILFDVDGTLAETEETHRRAFNQAFAEAGLDWRWSEKDYRRLLATAGGVERLARFMAEQGLPPDPAAVNRLHGAKNAIYAERLARGEVTPRPGIVRLIDEAERRGIALAIATTTSHANVAALLAHAFGVDMIRRFAVIAGAEDVSAKKPDPQVYHHALAALGLPAEACVAIEDSRNGLEAARAAGLATLVTRSRYFDHERFEEAALAVADLDGGSLRVDVDGVDALLASPAR